MKRKTKTLSLLILIVAMALTFISCNKEDDTGIWEDATYTENREFGSGAKTIALEVKTADKSVTFTIHTDKATLADALLEHGLVEGDEGQYGLYIKKVNGIEADYDKDGTYWAVYVNDDMAMTGISYIEVQEGGKYRLERTK